MILLRTEFFSKAFLNVLTVIASTFYDKVGRRYASGNRSAREAHVIRPLSEPRRSHGASRRSSVLDRVARAGGYVGAVAEHPPVSDITRAREKPWRCSCAGGRGLVQPITSEFRRNILFDLLHRCDVGVAASAIPRLQLGETSSVERAWQLAV